MRAIASKNYRIPVRSAASVTCGPPTNRMSTGEKLVLGGIVFLSMYVSAFAGVFCLPGWSEQAKLNEKGSKEQAPPPPPPSATEEEPPKEDTK